MATVHSYVHSKISDPLRHVQNDRFRESRRPKNVLFYPNGKPHYKPQQLRITPHKYNSFNDLLKDLTKTVKLPFGVRRVYTPTGGTEIADLDDLEDGNTYLCASFEKFKPANYGKKPVDNRPEWGPVGGRLNQNTDIVYTNLGYTPSTLQNAGTRGAGFRQYYYRSDRGTKLKPLGSTSEDSLLAPPVKRTLQKGTFGVAARDKYAGSMGHLGSRAPQNDISLTGQAKKFRIVHDMEPSKGYDFLFNERTSDNFERILQYVSETLKQNLRKFFTLKNREIKSLRELYRCSEDVLIATAKEHITEATVRAVRDAIYSYKNNSNNPSSSSGPYKTDSGFVDDLESDYDRTPRPKPHTAAKKVTSESSPQRAVIKNVSPNRKPRKRQQIGVDETEDDSSKPSDQQLSRVYQRRKERERKEREKMMTQQNERSEEDKRRRRQQARMDNERRKSVKRLTGDKQSKFGPLLGVEANKENDRPPQSERRGRSPTSDEIAVAEQMERARRKAENLGKSTTGFDSLESAAIVKHDKSTEEQKLREQAEKAEQKRKRLQDERNRHLQKDAAEKEKEKEKMKMEKDLMALSEQAEKQRKMAEAKPVDHKAQFEEANFIKKKKQNSDEPRRLSFESEEKILKDAEQNEKDRAKKERERRRAEAVQEKDTIASFPLEEAVKPAKAAPPVDDTVELEAALMAEKKRKQKEKEDEEEKRRLEALKAEEEAKQKAEEAKQKAEEERRKVEEEEKEREKKRAEEEARRAAEEKAEEERKAEEAAEAKRLAEEEAEKARKAAALEEAARLRKAEEERQQKEAEEKAKEEERKRQEQEEAERKKREAEKEKERQEAERKKREAEEEQKRKDAEAAAAEEKRKKDEAARKAAEEAEKEKEKVRPKGLILPIHEEEEIERKYELKKKMGDGNFANVYQALLKQGSIPPGAPPGQKEYAVKQIDKSKVVGSRKNTTSKVQMLKNEIDIMKGCDHPNICKLYEAYETDKHVYLVMEFVKGGDLFDAISENVKFDEPQSSLIIRHLAEALDYLHSRKIVHRDIKPENLLVDKDEKGRITQVKLGDFGLAMHVKEKIYSVCGTPTYVAPEILAETGYGLEVDNWATGVISYILLCGFPPFRSIERNQDELFDTIQRGEFEYLSPYWDNISDLAKDLIDRLLVVEIRKRMKSKEVLKHKFLTSHKD